MSGDIQFVDDIDWSVVEFTDAEVADATEDGAQEVLDRSQELVPKQIGDLAASARVRSVGANEVHKAAAVEYTSVYSHWIHEHLWFKHPSGGQAKFLEQALDEKGRDAIERAAKKLIGHG